MHQNTFGGRAPRGPDGGTYELPRTLSRNGEGRKEGDEPIIYKVRKGRTGTEGATSKGNGTKRRQKRRGREFPPKSR